MKSLLRLFFRLLYHQFAFTYDLVAAAVSMNRWKDWVASVIPFIEGTRVLEIGHGPGHLQHELFTLEQGRDFFVVGIDESPQMGRLAKRNLRESASQLAASLSPSMNSEQSVSAYTQVSLTRSVAQRLPFSGESFHTIVATFPTEYITDPQTLEEVKRCLANGGRLVVLPVAMPKNRLLDWLFKVTHQRPTEALDVIKSRLQEPFVAADFTTEVKTLDAKAGILLLVIATKPNDT